MAVPPLFATKYLACNDDFAQAVLRQEETKVTKSAQHILNLAIAVDVEQRIISRTLHLNDVSLRQMITVEGRLCIWRSVKECQHTAPWL